MVRTAIAAALLAAFVPGSIPAGAAPVSTAAETVTDVSSQSRPQRLRVYPGRLLYRECDFRLVRVSRPDGVFVVPRQRCWWVRG